MLAAAATAFALEALAPPAPASTPVVVAADDLAPGAHLDSSALRIVAWPADLVPAGALTTLEEATGRTLSAAMTQGEAVTSLRLVGPALAAALLEDGRVAAPVRLADSDVASLLRPGDHIDLVAASVGSADPVAGVSGTSTRVVASAATVVTVPTPDDGGSLLGSRTASGGALLLVAVTRAEALALAQAAVLGPISVLLVP